MSNGQTKKKSDCKWFGDCGSVYFDDCKLGVRVCSKEKSNGRSPAAAAVTAGV